MKRLQLGAFLLLYVMWVAPALSQTETAGAVVAQLQENLLAVMQAGDELGFHGRYERLAPVVRRTHALTLIARMVLGRQWRSLSAEQRQRFTDVFARLSISIYASRFEHYAGESFRMVGERRTSRGDALVQTWLIKGNGERVHLDYILRHMSGGWRIVNVIADGVSDLALKRAEYTHELQRSGFSGLIARLEAKIAQYQ